MSDKIRILQVFGSMNRGGAETMIMNMYRNIDRDKMQFDFVVHKTDKGDYDDEIYDLGGNIFYCERYNVINHFSYEKWWNKFFDEHKEYKIIHAHATGPAAVYIPIAKKHGLFAISHSHIALSQKGFRQAVNNMYRKPLVNISDYMFACSREAGFWMFGNDIENKSNYRVFNNAVDTEIFKYNENKRNEKRKELKLENNFVITNVSRFHEQKNHTFIIDIFEKVYEKNKNSKLLLVGDGMLKSEIENKVRDKGLQECVIFTGVRSDIPEILQASDVVLFPSLREGLPVALVEAQASGLKVICSDTISKEVKITNLVEMYSLSDSSEKWANEILKYYEGYDRKDMSDEIKKAGYDIKSSAKWLQEFYENILIKKR
ncbi:MAG TPA: glycosyltransferase family 1 protein [Candidatus Fimicola cottocaccae]|nr:glycosyltransferase family 1 protein [Candidatus Fimicola cottocaccae]